ncbi:hypothetical protein [Streptococcus sp. NLN64]|uniref:hypothetical protein n=1 Tax=Streptococcus sp. NLN64 TaxID=2822799 RepID=UPI0018C995D5|nr:hypothetical protein [Streptococcus sp. NLN64]MBG9366535.1 hypothetical protein [Streptococcus sp. NLN64]
MWTEDELIFLELALKDKESSWEEIAKALDRTVDAVQVKAWKAFRTYDLSKNNWSDLEIMQLKSLYPVKSAPEIAEILNRTPDAVWRKAQKLGLKKIGLKKIDKQEFIELADLGYSYRQIADELDKSIHAVCNFARHHKIEVRRTGQSKQHSWRQHNDVVFIKKSG